LGTRTKGREHAKAFGVIQGSNGRKMTETDLVLVIAPFGNSNLFRISTFEFSARKVTAALLLFRGHPQSSRQRVVMLMKHSGLRFAAMASKSSARNAWRKPIGEQQRAGGYASLGA
jgi:hypothetical protein